MNHFPLLLNSKQQENLIELSTARQFCVVTLQNDTLIHIIIVIRIVHIQK